MYRMLLISGGMAVVTALLASPTAANARDESDNSLRVMSFNVRYATANDGKNAWPARKQLLIDTIRAFDPDLLGTQEVLAEQADFLAEQLSGHVLIGAGRDDGKRKGEWSALLVRKERFELVDSGHFWLSKTPDVPGSKSWDSALTRMVTWARLRDRRQGAAPILYLNTHWDHQGEQARLESGRLMGSWIAKHADKDGAVVVTGDFNTSETTPPYRELLAGGSGGVQLFDAFRRVVPQPGKDEATFHGFTGVKSGQRIDWILSSRQLLAAEATIDRSSRDGRFPSDHFPVTAVLRWASAADK